MATNKPTPQAVPISDALYLPRTLNVATEINRPSPDEALKDPRYNSTTDESRASRRAFLHPVRTHAEAAAARTGDLPLGDGLTLRMAMAGQCENDQFPFETDPFGKQRA